MNDFLIKNYSPYIGTTPISGNETSVTTASSNNGAAFKELLQQQLQFSNTDLVFSKHAMKRIDEREISISQGLLNDVSDAVTRAGEKGIKDALILGNNTAFIVNVPTRTVITTMGSQDMKQNVITNIDGTVIIQPDLFWRLKARNDR